jgi:small-conductance mechanosensitive channel
MWLSGNPLGRGIGMEILLESLTEQWQGLVRLSPRILMAVLVLAVFIWIGRLLGRAIVHFLRRGNFKPTHRNFFRNLTAWLLGMIGLITGLNILGLRGLAASLAAGGGVTAIVIGFAFREIGENFLAGFFLAFSRPFEVGDLVQSGELQGTVRSIEMRSTHVRTADGRDIFIPSSQIFNNALINYTKDGLRRLSFQVGIDYADNSEEARQTLLEAVSGTDNVLRDPRPGVNMSALAPQYVELEIFFWIDTFQKGVDLAGVRNEVIERCRCALMAGDYIVSSNVTSNVALGGFKPLEVSVSQAAG